MMTDDEHESFGAMVYRGKVEAKTNFDTFAEVSLRDENARLRAELAAERERVDKLCKALEDDRRSPMMRLENALAVLAETGGE